MNTLDSGWLNEVHTYDTLDSGWLNEVHTYEYTR